MRVLATTELIIGLSMGCKRVLLVTGISGAGRSTTLKILEDIGYQAIDNLPIRLLASIVKPKNVSQIPLAIGFDVRSEDFDAKKILKETEILPINGELDFNILFLDCDDEILLSRFTKTGRRHPLAVKRTVIEAIKLERQLMAPLQKVSNDILDTSLLKLSDLRRILKARYSIEGKKSLMVFVSSFSYRFGLPRESDMVFDVRFLSNPFYVSGLKTLSGLDQRVAEFISKDPQYKFFFATLTKLFEILLPSFVKKGKSYLSISVGCTGGKHRSVFVVERLSTWLEENGLEVERRHRDLESSCPEIENLKE